MDTSQELQQKPKGRGYRGGNMREGEIVQVQGGHIIRATGRKDRHSKVFTAKGPRDRRVRLSAHTAIQFYDVQDRLGYDRPSKAVDWLMKKAKSAIDKLDVLPPFNPSAIVELGQTDLVNRDESESSRFEIGHFHPPTTAETMKSFFPSSSTTNPMGFHGYPHQDLCLSLQSFQNPGLVHSQSDPGKPNSNQALYPVEYETGNSSGWTPESNMNEMGQFSRLLAWSGGTLQSNFHPQPSIRAWDDLPMSSTNADHQNRIPKVEGMQQMQNGDGFMGFEDMHGINLSYNHNSASSMSTDSSR